MGKLLFVLFTLVPFVELYLLLVIGREVGFWPTLASVVLVGLVGAWLAKREGLRVFRRFQESLAKGQMPEEGILNGVLVILGGALLVAPGVITDLVGVLLLVPYTRKSIAAFVRKHLEKRFAGGGGAFTFFSSSGTSFGGFGAPRARGDVIDVEGEVVERKVDPNRRLGR